MSQQLLSGCCCGPIQPSECPDDCPECNDAYAFSINMSGFWSFAGEDFVTTLNGSGVLQKENFCRWVVLQPSSFTQTTSLANGAPGGFYSGTFDVSVNFFPTERFYSCLVSGGIARSQVRITTRGTGHRILFVGSYSYSACPYAVFPNPQTINQSLINLGSNQAQYNVTSLEIFTS